jgi:hypothetical protein
MISAGYEGVAYSSTHAINMLCTHPCDAQTRETEDEWIDSDECGARLQLLKPYHRATSDGRSLLPKLGIFRETQTVTFATQVPILIQRLRFPYVSIHCIFDPH